MGRALRRKPIGAAGSRATALLQITKAGLAAIAFAVTAGRRATTAMACVTLITAAKATLGGCTSVAISIATAGRVAKAALAATTTLARDESDASQPAQERPDHPGHPPGAA